MSKIGLKSTRGDVSGSGIWRLNLLGPFYLSRDGSEIALSSKKNRALLAILALSPGQRMSREKLCGLLWGDRGEEQARSSLRQSMAVLRRELCEAESGLFSQQDEVIALRSNALSIDIINVGRLVASGDKGSLHSAMELYRGELLADIALREAAFDEWLSAEKRQTAAVILQLHVRLAEMESGIAAIEAAKKLVALDPLRESSHRLLMKALANSGEKALALKQYEECERLLKSEFGVEPAHETKELRETLIHESGGPGGPAARGAVQSGFAPPSTEPAVAVLPFAFHGSGDLRYLEDGIAEDIVTELSRHRTLRVIATASAVTQRSVNDPQQAGRTLGVTHVVTGSLRPAGDKLRMSAQLVEVASGASLLSVRYDLPHDDVQASLDRLVATLAPVIEGRIGSAAAEQVSRRPVASWSAYDHYLKGRDLSLRYLDAEALPHLDRAIELDPSYAPAFAWRALVCVGIDFSRADSPIMQLAERSALRAIELDDRDVRSHHAMGYVRLWQKRHELAGAHYDSGLRLNPSDIFINYERANWLTYGGRPQEGLDLTDSLRERDPFPPVWVSEIRARALFQLGRYAEALAEYEKVSTRHVWGYWSRAACYAMLGRFPEAREEIRRMRVIKPDATLALIRSLSAFAAPSLCQSLFDALAAAGLPD